MAKANKTWVVLPAGGAGKRMGGDRPKQYLELQGIRILDHTLRRFNSFEWVDGIVLALPADEVEAAQDLQRNYSRLLACVSGGLTRCQSVYNGIAALPFSDDDVILVHDAVRPLVGEALCRRVQAETLKNGAAIAALPLKGTIKRATSNHCIAETVDRRLLWEAQTPQGALGRHFKRAYDHVQNWSDAQCESITDEAMLMESIGVPVALVEGEETNLKITRPLDLRIAEALLR